MLQTKLTRYWYWYTIKSITKIMQTYVGIYANNTTSFGLRPYHIKNNIKSRRFTHNYMCLLQENGPNLDTTGEANLSQPRGGDSESMMPFSESFASDLIHKLSYCTFTTIISLGWKKFFPALVFMILQFS